MFIKSDEPVFSYSHMHATQSEFTIFCPDFEDAASMPQMVCVIWHTHNSKKVREMLLAVRGQVGPSDLLHFFQFFCGKTINALIQFE